MSRDLDEENYYISNGGKIPVKWTAPEVTIITQEYFTMNNCNTCIIHRRYTIRSILQPVTCGVLG